MKGRAYEARPFFMYFFSKIYYFFNFSINSFTSCPATSLAPRPIASAAATASDQRVRPKVMLMISSAIPICLSPIAAVNIKIAALAIFGRSFDLLVVLIAIEARLAKYIPIPKIIIPTRTFVPNTRKFSIITERLLNPNFEAASIIANRRIYKRRRFPTNAEGFVFEAILLRPITQRILSNPIHANRSLVSFAINLPIKYATATIIIAENNAGIYESTVLSITVAGPDIESICS